MNDRSIPQWIFDVCTADSALGYRLQWIFVLTLTAALSLLLLRMGAPHIAVMPWDIFIQLDGGWRILNGQIPHVDYYTPLAPLPFLLTAAGMKLAPPSTSAITYGNVILLAVATPWAWLIARSRMSTVHALLFVSFTAFLLIAPRALGDTPRATTYAMIYNRFGFALLSMLFVERLLMPRGPMRPRAWLLGAFSSGLILALLLLCKITYFIFGIAGVLLHLFLRREKRISQSISMIVGFSVVAAAAGLLLRLDLAALVSDAALASMRQSPVRFWLALRLLLSNFPQFYLLFFAMLVLMAGGWPAEPPPGRRFLRHEPVLTSSFIAFSGLVLCSTNCQPADIPLLFIAGLVLAEYLRRAIRSEENPGRPILQTTAGIKYLAAVMVATYLFAGIFLKDVTSTMYAVAWHELALPRCPDSERLQSRTLRDFVVDRSAIVSTVVPRTNVEAFTVQINDGLSLLRRHASKDTRVLTMGFSNPFSFALELPPPRGDALWWQVDVTFNETLFPAGEKVFNDVDLVMVPRFPERTEATATMERIYRDRLDLLFYEKETTSFWTLLARKPDRPGG
ncbi:MAG: hypothetical protein AB1640_00295 [bacterium]